MGLTQFIHNAEGSVESNIRLKWICNNAKYKGNRNTKQNVTCHVSQLIESEAYIWVGYDYRHVMDHTNDYEQ